MKAKKKWLLLAGALGLVAIVCAFFSNGLHHDRLHWKPRKDWKEAAITSIERRATDREWLEREVAAVKAKLESHGEDDGNWLSSGLILMKNGDWIAYDAKCSKEDIRIHDIFIGRASDGKWYYSTFHFCIGMLELRVEERSDSLAKFITAYSLREFDGRSDECLNKTWPIPKP